ncbi:MAG: type II toxin-antitoxin system RelE/ParE family toxin [Campylobacteraceae bacterium]|nr:type II toxin-antitoxin system RelE/ParE family toxin [Campylobacteraceae bacterium]
MLKYIKELQALENPRSRGKGLTGNLRGLWRYRVDDYRLVCVQDEKLIILVLKIKHRSNVYQ